MGAADFEIHSSRVRWNRAPCVDSAMAGSRDCTQGRGYNMPERDTRCTFGIEYDLCFRGVVSLQGQHHVWLCAYGLVIWACADVCCACFVQLLCLSLVVMMAVTRGPNSNSSSCRCVGPIPSDAPCRRLLVGSDLVVFLADERNRSLRPD